MADTLTTTATNLGASTASASDPTQSTAGTISGWSAPYITNMLGKGMAYSNMPFTGYSGELVAGPSGLQSQAFQGIAGLTAPYTGTDFTPERATATEFTGSDVLKYMNPYVSNVVSPQIREAQRQAEIQRIANAKNLVGAGAFGGSRQAIMEAEGNRNLQTLLSDITGKGYQGAFENAQQQFERDQARRMAAQALNVQTGLEADRATEASKQFGAQYGLDTLARQLAAGETQRGIEQQGLSADYEQYLRQFNYPKEQLQFQSDLLKNIPEKALTTLNTYGVAPSTLTKLLGAGTGILGLLSAANTLGSNTGGLSNIYSGIGKLFSDISSGSNDWAGGMTTGQTTDEYGNIIEDTTYGTGNNVYEGLGSDVMP